MEDHYEAIATASDEQSLRRAYAGALAEHGARGEALEFRRLFVGRRNELGAPAPVDEVDESNRLFGRWALRCLSGEEPRTELETEFDRLTPALGERDRRRYSRVLAAQEDWLRARSDQKVDDALLRGFLARLTGAAAGKAPPKSEKSVRRLQKKYGRVYAVDPDWFESAAVSGAAPVVGFLKKYWIWFAIAAAARAVLKIIQMIEKHG